LYGGLGLYERKKKTPAGTIGGARCFGDQDDDTSGTLWCPDARRAHARGALTPTISRASATASSANEKATLTISCEGSEPSVAAA